MTPEQAETIQRDDVQQWLREHAPVAAGWRFWNENAKRGDDSAWEHSSGNIDLTNEMYAAMLVGACVGSGLVSIAVAVIGRQAGRVAGYWKCEEMWVFAQWHDDAHSAVLAAIASEIEA